MGVITYSWWRWCGGEKKTKGKKKERMKERIWLWASDGRQIEWLNRSIMSWGGVVVERWMAKTRLWEDVNRCREAELDLLNQLTAPGLVPSQSVLSHCLCVIRRTSIAVIIITVPSAHSQSPLILLLSKFYISVTYICDLRLDSWKKYSIFLSLCISDPPFLLLIYVHLLLSFPFLRPFFSLCPLHFLGPLYPCFLSIPVTIKSCFIVLFAGRPSCCNRIALSYMDNSFQGNRDGEEKATECTVV